MKALYRNRLSYPAHPLLARKVEIRDDRAFVETQSALKWPMIRWSAIVDTLDESVHLLSEGIEPEISRGYLKMATELRDRIDLHREPRLIK